MLERLKLLERVKAAGILSRAPTATSPRRSAPRWPPAWATRAPQPDGGRRPRRWSATCRDLDDQGQGLAAWSFSEPQ